MVKKIFLLFAATFAAMAIASCDKETVEAQVEQNPTVEFAVSDINAGTRASKSGWTAGDKINIWFDQGPDKYLSTQTYSPELILTHDGGGWDCQFASHFDKSTLCTSGVIRAVYESTNDFNETFYYQNRIPQATEVHYAYNPPIADFNCYSTPMMVVSNVEYTYDGDLNKITANLDCWEFLTRIKVLVEGLSRHTSFYKLQTTKQSDSYGFLIPLMGFYLSTDLTCHNWESENSFGAGGGTTTNDGVEFYFYDTDSNGKAVNYEFMLGVFDPSIRRFVNYTYVVEGKTINSSSDKLFSIRIDKEKFNYFGI